MHCQRGQVIFVHLDEKNLPFIQCKKYPSRPSPEIKIVENRKKHLQPPKKCSILYMEKFERKSFPWFIE